MRILLVLVFLFLPLSVFAQIAIINEIAWPVESAYAADHGLKMGTVIINEVAWMGSPVEGVDAKQWWRYEWLELFNAKDQPLQIDGWAVDLYRGEELYFKIPLVGIVPAFGYFLVGASDKILPLRGISRSETGVDVNYSNLGGKFLNTGQRVVLSNASGVVVDEVDATSGWPAGDNKTKQTMERAAGSEGVSEEWQTSAKPGGTPKAQNSSGVTRETVREITGQTKPSLVKDEVKLSLTKDETEKDLSRSFQSRVPLVNPITLLAGLLALGFSGVLLLVKRSLASRQERQKLKHPERNLRT